MLRRMLVVRCMPSSAYSNFVSMGVIEDDPHQRNAIARCDRLCDDLANLVAASRQPGGPSLYRDLTPRPKEHQGLIPIPVLIKREQRRVDRANGVIPPVHPLSATKGLYIYGGTGTGKTTITDIMFHSAPVVRKQRVHFRQFIHEAKAIADRAFKIHKWKKEDSEQLVNELAVRLCSNAEFMVFDDVRINDEEEADVLRRAFTGMFQLGICAVFAAGAPPSRLYDRTVRGRKMMAPFIGLIENHCELIDLGNSVDYRITSGDTLRGAAPYLTASSSMTHAEAKERFNQAFLLLCAALAPQPTVIRAYGRDIEVPKAVGGVCRFTFDELLAACPGGRRDFALVAKRFHTVFVERVPQFDAIRSEEERDRLSYFTEMVDALHYFGCKTVILAAAPVTQLILPLPTIGSPPAVEAVESGEAPHGGLAIGVVDTTTQLAGGASSKTPLDDTVLAAATTATSEEDVGGASVRPGRSDLALLPERLSVALVQCEQQLAVMQSHEYLRTPHKGRGEVLLMDGAPDVTEDQLDAIADESLKQILEYEAAFNAMARLSETSWPMAEAKSQKKSGNPYANWKHPISKYMRADESLYEV